MGWLLNNPQVIVVLLIFGGSFLQWLLKTLAEQKAARQRQAEAEQRELEALRTGREPAPPMGVPAEFSREAELAELRRRAQARAEQSARQDRIDPGMPMPQPTGQPAGQPNPLEILLGLPPGSTSGGTVPPRTGRSRDIAAERRKRQQSRSTSIPQAESGDDRGTAEARAVRMKAREQQKRADRARREQTELEARAARAQQARADQATAAAEKQRDLATAPRAPRAAVAVGGLPNTRASWRQALIVSEILNKPLALRTDADRGIL